MLVKRCSCSATVDEKQAENLMECVNIIGAAPTYQSNTVSVLCEGTEMVDRLVKLFEQYPTHEIYVLITQY